MRMTGFKLLGLLLLGALAGGAGAHTLLMTQYVNQAGKTLVAGKSLWWSIWPL